MSWQDDVKNIELVITTGDGKEWRPLWKDAVKDVEYNVSDFEAIDIEGTYVDRKKKKGDKFPITLYFNGGDCIDQARLFEESARDSRAWTYKHPFFDIVKVQPSKLKFDYSGLNSVKITGVLRETIANKYPKKIETPGASVLELAPVLLSEIEEYFVAEIDEPLPGNISFAAAFINAMNAAYKKVAEIREDIAKVKELARAASSAAQNMIASATGYIEAMKDLVNFPFVLIQNIESKINALVASARDLADIFISTDGVLDAEVISKNIITYEANASLILGTIAQVSVDSDYSDSNTVFSVIDSISEIYSEVISNYDSLGYNQNPDVAFQLDTLINLAIGNLYDIAFDSKKEITVILPYDSNIVLLAHKYYGRGDDHLNDFIEKNNIKSNEYLQIKAGREIVYYV